MRGYKEVKGEKGEWLERNYIRDYAYRSRVAFFHSFLNLGRLRGKVGLVLEINNAYVA